MNNKPGTYENYLHFRKSAVRCLWFFSWHCTFRSVYYHYLLLFFWIRHCSRFWYKTKIKMFWLSRFVFSNDATYVSERKYNLLLGYQYFFFMSKAQATTWIWSQEEKWYLCLHCIYSKLYVNNYKPLNSLFICVTHNPYCMLINIPALQNVKQFKREIDQK